MDGTWIQMIMGLLGEDQAGKLTTAQLRMLEKQLANIEGIDLPDLPEISPEQLGESELGLLESDQALRGDQLQMLGDMRETIDAGGLSLSDKAALLEALGDASATGRRARLNVKADLGRRGGLDSGAQMMAGMQSASDVARDAGKAGLETAAMAERRKLQLMREYLAGTGALRGQDWAESTTTAGARDKRAEGNADRREKSNYYNAGLPQQNFANRMTKATGQQAPGNNLSAFYGNQAQGTRDFWGNMGAAAGTAANNSFGGSSGSSSGGGGTQKRDANGDPYETEPEEWENPWA